MNFNVEYSTTVLFDFQKSFCSALEILPIVSNVLFDICTIRISATGTRGYTHFEQIYDFSKQGQCDI